MSIVPDMDWSPLANLGNVYRKARREADLEQANTDIGSAFASGNVDYNKLGGQLIKSGRLQEGMSLIKMGEEARADGNFTGVLRSFGQPGAQPQQPAQTQPLSSIGQPPASGPPIDQYGRAIAGIESGGQKDPYTAIGPATKNGARAVGKYQVMDFNVGPWTKEILGQEMTPQQFAASPDAQEAVFKHKFGQYVAQTGNPQDAASMWFTGKPLAQGANRADVNGMTGQRYVDKFTAGLGAQPTPGVIGFNGAPEGPGAAGHYGPDATLPTEQPPQPAPYQVAQAGGGPFPVPGGAQPAPQPQAPQSQVPGTQLSTNPADGRILELAAASGSRSLSPARQAVAKVLLEHALKDTEKTKDEKEYWRTYVPQEVQAGRKPKSYEDFQITQRRAGVESGGETTFEKGAATEQVKRFSKDITAGDRAQDKLVDIQQMREIGKRVGSQGAAAGVKEVVGPWLEAVGIDVSKLSDIQAYQSVIQRLAPQNRVEGSGSTSDVEFKGMLKSMPSLMQNPAAREITLNTMEAFARHEMARGDIASRLFSKEITRGQAEKERRALPDPMTQFREWRKANPQVYGAALSESTKPQAAQQAAPQQGAGPPLAAPTVGDIQKGHKYLGGDPAVPGSWEKVQ